MTIINDYFMMTVDQRYESSISPSGIITLSTAWINETVVERFPYKRRYGRIEAVPDNFTDTVIAIEDPGVPQPRKFISGEYIEAKVKQGYHKMTRQYYCCSSLDQYPTITRADIAKDTDIRRFDRCYFDPRVTEPYNLIGMHQGKELYKIGVEEVICVVRDGEILMQSDWCLVEPEMETWESITTKAGIIMKPAPEAIALRGKMRHFQHRDDLNPGDRIAFLKGADWLMKVEGKEYYAIQKDDIVCKFAA